MEWARSQKELSESRAGRASFCTQKCTPLNAESAMDLLSSVEVNSEEEMNRLSQDMVAELTGIAPGKTCGGAGLQDFASLRQVTWRVGLVARRMRYGAAREHYRSIRSQASTDAPPSYPGFPLLTGQAVVPSGTPLPCRTPAGPSTHEFRPLAAGRCSKRPRCLLPSQAIFYFRWFTLAYRWAYCLYAGRKTGPPPSLIRAERSYVSGVLCMEKGSYQCPT